jgi:hypothetical protein
MMRLFVLILFSLTALAAAQNTKPGTPDFSAVIFIHGDGDYTYSDNNNNLVNSDEEILFKAVKAAEKLRSSEVFIYHYKKQETSFVFFKGNDVDMYFYQNGSLVRKSSMQRKTFNFKDELDFYRKYHVRSIKNLMLYYGHEIPVTGGKNYNASYQDEPFNLTIFTAAVKDFFNNQKADLIVLSSDCSGIPLVINALSAYTNYIVASPDKLGSRFINPFHIKKLNYYGTGSFEDFVVEFSSASFREIRNENDMMTVVSAYKTGELSFEFLQKAIREMPVIAADENLLETCDLADYAGDLEGASKGVIVYYNPPAGGRWMAKMEHSGWGCKRIKNSAFLENTGSRRLSLLLQH